MKNRNSDSNGAIYNPYIGFILLTWLLFLLCLPFGNAKEDQRKEWIIKAHSFIEADRLMRLNANRPSFLEHLQKRDQIETSFKNGRAPSVHEIEDVVSSEDPEKQSVACVAVYITGYHSNRIIERLVDILHNNKPFELVRLSLFALKKVPLEDLMPFEDAIFQAIEREDDALVLSEKILFLMKFPPEKSAGIATNLILNKDDAGIKRLAYGLLHKFGPAYTKPVLEELKRRDDKKSLDIIKEMETPEAKGDVLH